LDHFDALSTTTFEQRYYVNETFWVADGPVFRMLFLLSSIPLLMSKVYVGGESALTASRVQSGEIVELAMEHCMCIGSDVELSSAAALVVALEHRYYGLSHPFSQLTTENLQFLSSQQAYDNCPKNSDDIYM